jgi:predicted nucleic acid-binding protein
VTVPASHLLDTSVLSQPVKDRPLQPALDRWSALGELAVCTSAICVAEILQGLETRASAKYWRRYRALLEDRYRVLPFDAGVAVTFARLGAQMASRGLPRPALDLMIAATAVHHGLVLATLNTQDFAGIEGLTVEDWSAPG